MRGQSLQNHPRLVIGAQYFVHFGVLGIFLPYFNLYCYHLGFGGFQIGTLSSLRSMAMIGCSILWSLVADRFGVRRPIYILCSFAYPALWSLYLFTESFLPMALITVAYAIFFAPIVSFLESFAMDVLGGDKKGYGRLRVWGTLSFIGVVSVMGRVIDQVPIAIILVLILAGASLQATLSLGTPKVAIRKKAGFFTGARDLFTPPVVVFLVCGFLMLVSHSAYYGFFSIHLEQLGFSAGFTGAAWALAAGAEVLVMVNSSRIFARFSQESVLIFSLSVAALRWFTLSQVQSPLLILLSQTLHAVTYGTFHIASILYIDRMSPGVAKTVGQAVNHSLTYGLGLMIGFMVNGALFERVGTFAMFGVSGGVALGAAVVLGVFRRRGKEAPL
jgi:PPP family 3-phenylpropionic acid transporter